MMNLFSPNPRLLCLTLFGTLALGVVRADPMLMGYTSLYERGLQKESSVLLVALKQPLLFTYGTWEKRTRIEGEHLVLRGEGITPKGGGGANLALDLSAAGQNSPALRVRAGAGNTLKTMRLLLIDSEKNQGVWEFPAPAPGDSFTDVTPGDGASFLQPNTTEKPGKSPDLRKIVQWQITGDWGGDGPVDIEVAGIWSAIPTPALQEQRQAREIKNAQEIALRRREQEDLKTKYGTRTALSPLVTHVSLVAPDVIAVEISAGHILPASLTRYGKQAGDTFQEKKDDTGTVQERRLVRGGRDVGWLIGPNRDWLTTREGFEGDPLLEFVADDAANFSVSSADDPLFMAPLTPVSVARKSKPTNWGLEGAAMEMRHTLFLRLPKPLTEGRRYTVRFGALNTRQAQLTFTNDPARVRSEAVHVNQIGYRPDDPAKRAFVSCWMGTGGSLPLPSSLSFSLIEEKTGRKVFQGKSERLWRADKPELMQHDKNFNGTDVLRLDFSAFTVPGRYRVRVDGIGCSYPFEIGPNVWLHAFRVQMRGLFHQRSGIALGPPYTAFRKPRDMNPADQAQNGTRVTWSAYRAVENGGEAFTDIAKGDTGRPANGWGGYQDAGDWNPRRVTHMRVTMAQLEVFDLFPQTFAPLKLNIPPRPGVPDLLTEAIFEFECFHRLQQKDGGVGFGLETQGDPKDGEVSWLQSMPVYALSPDYSSSWYYAMAGARLAFLLRKYDPKLASVYQKSAATAFEWAEKDFARDQAAGLTAKRSSVWEAKDTRNAAALELYRLTGAPKWHAIFLENTVLTEKAPDLFQWGKAVQRDQAFLYARLPKNQGDAALKKKATTAICVLAQHALAYAENNAFNLTTPDKGKPMFLGFYTTPDATDLIHAHYLTGESKYLAGAVQSTQFQSGENPSNLVYTSGLGANPVKHPFKLDARRTGQSPPEGLTPYGNVDLSAWGNQAWIIWPITYFLSKNTTPDPYAWPTSEAYWDLGGWPALNEFTVDAWAPNISVWGYLAARR